MIEVIKLSVILPVLNEEEHMEKIIRFFLHALPLNKELIIIDGGSTDRTLEIAERFAFENSENIRVLHNPRKYVPFALNLGIAAARGEYICRVDGHSYYEEDYFEKIQETFFETNADIVGGPWRSVGETDLQKAFVIATGGPFGTGGNILRDESYRGFTDHVVFGAWKREIFTDIGLFDVDLIRNQDEEFHYRARAFGKKIFQNPEIRMYYTPRSSYSGLFKQYFQYGLYKPRVTLKVRKQFHLRHIVPGLFVLYLSALVPFTFFYKIALLPMIAYFAMVLFFSVRDGENLKQKCFLLLIFPVLHISYGLGYLLGIPAALRARYPRDVVPFIPSRGN